MAVTTSLSRAYLLQRIFTLVVCLGLGLWGVYDYFVRIPHEAEAYQRFRVCESVRDALEPRSDETSNGSNHDQRVSTAEELVDARVSALLGGTGNGDSLQSVPENEEELQRKAERLQDAVQSLDSDGQKQWLVALALFKNALNTPRDPSETLKGVHQAAWKVASDGVAAFDDAAPPGKWDRLTQIGFILCLLGVPWAGWSLVRAKSERFVLNDDGTLVTPEGEYAPEKIADIDMSRWMKKSIAYVVITDGQRIKLDDYLHRNTHLIVGAIASQMYPDQWTEDAREVKTAETGDDGTATMKDDVPAQIDNDDASTEAEPARATTPSEPHQKG